MTTLHNPTPGVSGTRHGWVPYVLSAPAMVLLLSLLTTPLVLLVRVSFYEPGRGYGYFTAGTWTTSHYTAILDGWGVRLLGFTFVFSLAVAVLTVPAAFFVSLFIRELSPVLRRIALAVVLLPKLVGVLPILFGIQQLLGEAGPLQHVLHFLGLIEQPVGFSRGMVGALIGEVYLIFPYAVLLLVVQLGTIDPALTEAARGLGASGWKTFWRITLPLAAPGLTLTTQLCLVWGMGAFLGPLILGSPDQATLSVEIHRQAFEYSRWPRAASLAVLLTASVGVCSALSLLPTFYLRRSVRS